MNITAPASPPDDIMAFVASSTQILVTWAMVPPMDQNGVITMYEVQYEPLETFGGTIQTQTVNLTEISATLNGLEEFVSYSISVRAYTSVGEGPYSVGVTAMTLEDSEFLVQQSIGTF